jgi:hypothetical protein
VNSPLKNKELPLWLQFTALFVLWAVWLGLVVWVQWREVLIKTAGRYFAEPSEVYAPLLVGIPLVLFFSELLFLRRVGPPARLPLHHRLLYYVHVGLMPLAGLIILIGCVMATTKIRD